MTTYYLTRMTGTFSNYEDNNSLMTAIEFDLTYWNAGELRKSDISCVYSTDKELKKLCI